MRIIFLDIDGVLNNNDTYIRVENEYEETGIINIEIDEFRVEYLSRIVERTGAKIVLTSSLRNKFKKVGDEVVPNSKWFALDFINVLNKYNLIIYDLLPYIMDSDGKEVQRQVEIYEYLFLHGDVESFVILDDETINLMDFVGTNLIKLSNLPVGVMVRSPRDTIGLCEEHIEQAVDILNNKELVKKYVRKKKLLYKNC